MLREVDLGLLFKYISLAGRNRVPKFRFSLVKKIDGRQIEVLFVPAEHGLPGPDIAVGGSYSPYLNVNGMV